MLSAWSPVISAKSIRLPSPFPCGTGLLGAKRLIWRIEASIRNGWKASCGRQAELAPGSANSTLAGDSSSASWKSVSWEK